jgi:hypothetical protein
MMTPSATSRRIDGHDTHVSGGAVEAECPYCGQPISRKEFNRIRERIADEERARVAKVEQTLQDKFAREQQEAAIKAKAEIEKARREATKAAEAQIRAARANQEAIITQRVATAREAADKRLAEAVAAEKTRAYEDRMRLDAQLADLQRKLQRKTAGELGDALEIDAFDELKRAFPGDHITRVPKGAPGADIIHRVIQNGTALCGTIIFDCKNHKRWQNKFISKLRQDQIDHEADFAVLATSVFPAGSSHSNQLAIIDGVIVASPARVIVLAHLLRRQIVQMYMLRLGNADRDGKRDALFNFITSDRCTQLLDRIGSLSSDLSDLDSKEETTHRTVWKKRSELIRAIQSANGEFLSEVDRIITTSTDVSE